MTRLARKAAPDVQSVTSAGPSVADEQNARIRRYLWMMGIRTVCFVLVVVVPGWPKWIFGFCAVFLPYFAVVLVNKVFPTTPRVDLPGPADPRMRHLEG